MSAHNLGTVLDFLINVCIVVDIVRFYNVSLMTFAECLDAPSPVLFKL